MDSIIRPDINLTGLLRDIENADDVDKKLLAKIMLSLQTLMNEYGKEDHHMSADLYIDNKVHINNGGVYIDEVESVWSPSVASVYNNDVQAIPNAGAETVFEIDTTHKITTDITLDGTTDNDLVFANAGTYRISAKAALTAFPDQQIIIIRIRYSSGGTWSGATDGTVISRGDDWMSAGAANQMDATADVIYTVAAGSAIRVTLAHYSGDATENTVVGIGNNGLFVNRIA
jgi:hypothetical protein